MPGVHQTSFRHGIALWLGVREGGREGRKGGGGVGFQTPTTSIFAYNTVVLEIIAGIKHCDFCIFRSFSLKCDF